MSGEWRTGPADVVSQLIVTNYLSSALYAIFLFNFLLIYCKKDIGM
jgi:hypothetical protein